MPQEKSYIIGEAEVLLLQDSLDQKLLQALRSAKTNINTNFHTAEPAQHSQPLQDKLAALFPAFFDREVTFRLDSQYHQPTSKADYEVVLPSGKVHATLELAKDAGEKIHSFFPDGWPVDYEQIKQYKSLLKGKSAVIFSGEYHANAKVFQPLSDENVLQSSNLILNALAAGSR